MAALEQLEPLGRALRAGGIRRSDPGWPDDPETVKEANARPEAFAGKSVGQIADHLVAVIGELERQPVVIGHSFGGLLTEIIAGRGFSSASVAIDPAQFRGVLPLPFSALRSSWPVLRNPANRNRAVSLTYEQFRYGFANAVDEGEAKALYRTFSVAGIALDFAQRFASPASERPSPVAS